MITLWLSLLLSSVVWAEEEYFPQGNSTWENARLHCQDCFKELTTVTSRNVHLIVKNLSSDHWIGLRRSYNGTIPWSMWSNEDPVTYQNWYPGHPIPNTEKPIPICPTPMSSTSSITSTVTSTPITSKATTTTTADTYYTSLPANRTDMCPILIDILDCLNMSYADLENTVRPYIPESTSTTKTTTYSTSTSTTITTAATTTAESTTAENCVFEPEPDPEVYIEDACVVLLSFGMWKEAKCNKSLPFICYEERFFGDINISDITTSTANLSWSEGPGAKNISDYKVEINNQRFNETKLLHMEISNLTAGTKYSVQVFPVKCGRNLNPQNISFYTKPSEVKDLVVVSVTTVSVFLKWSEPGGGHHFYKVLVKNMTDGYGDQKTVECPQEQCNITDLTPGVAYNFTVSAVVNKTTEGVPSSISNYTKPSRVLNLKSFDNCSNEIVASWDQPDGYHSGYHYCLKAADNGSKCTDSTANSTADSSTTNSTCATTINKSINEAGLSAGTKYYLCVTALTNNDNLPGETVVISAYTEPRTVNLTLTSYSKSITANWTIEEKYEYFTVSIRVVSDSEEKTAANTTQLSYTFTGLSTAVQYNITVVTRNGDLKSDPVTSFIYTKPTSPRSPKAIVNKTEVILTWEPPEESKEGVIDYSVECHTAFWSETFESKTNSTKLTYKLKPGTTYDFNIRVVAGNNMSDPVHTTANTEPVKQTMSIVMQCSSDQALHCGTSDIKNEILQKLNISTGNKFNGVYWKLKWVDRK